ncbi:MAG: hypothetical protein HY863_07370 [Chloroflexi bacterium]|nr:hypothetical protein [Chloroflexota bacterium]
MLEGKMSQIPVFEVIALPPLKMVLVHAMEERANRMALESALEKVIKQEEQIKVKSLIKIIEYLEQRK